MYLGGECKRQREKKTVGLNCNDRSDQISKWGTLFAGAIANWTQQRLTFIFFLRVFFFFRLTPRGTSTHMNTLLSTPINWHFFPVLLTCFPHLIFTVSQQFKDVHLQLARGWAVTVPVDAVFGQRDGQTLSSAALHRVIKDGSWEEGKRKKMEKIIITGNCRFFIWKNQGGPYGQWSFNLRTYEDRSCI